MDEGRALVLCFHGPAETDRLRFGHIRSHEQDAVTVRHVLLVICGRTAAERGAQTGHRGAMSYSRLVFDRHDPQSAAEQLFNEVVFFVVDGGPAQRTDAAH